LSSTVSRRSDAIVRLRRVGTRGIDLRESSPRKEHYKATFSVNNVCGHPPVPVNAKLVRDGAKATFVCDDGYRLFGSESITCSSNGAWTGDLPFCGTNVAVHKPTNQSTTARGGSPGNANDGDPTTVHDGRRCTETLKEPSPWWSVDLLQPYPVRAVSITTRGCCGE
ncbi:sushi, von Willebrand factor type A, EGF and pentraxin domain-containing protein 1, partial [Aphis craccivora]